MSLPSHKERGSYFGKLSQSIYTYFIAFRATLQENKGKQRTLYHLTWPSTSEVHNIETINLNFIESTKIEFAAADTTNLNILDVQSNFLYIANIPKKKFASEDQDSLKQGLADNIPCQQVSLWRYLTSRELFLACLYLPYKDQSMPSQAKVDGVSYA